MIYVKNTIILSLCILVCACGGGESNQVDKTPQTDPNNLKTPTEEPLQGKNVKYESLDGLSYGGSRNQYITVLHNDNSLKKELMNNKISVASNYNPNIDFTKKQLFVNSRGCYGDPNSISIDSIKDLGDYILVNTVYQYVGSGLQIEETPDPYVVLAINSKKTILIKELFTSCSPEVKPSGGEKPITYEVIHGSDNVPDVSHDYKDYDRRIQVYDKSAYQTELARYTAVNNVTVASNQQILLIDRGWQSSSGYSIQIDSVTENNHQATVNITYTNPGDGCPKNNAITIPYRFVLVNSTKRIAVHEKLEKAADCS